MHIYDIGQYIMSLNNTNQSRCIDMRKLEGFLYEKIKQKQSVKLQKWIR